LLRNNSLFSSKFGYNAAGPKPVLGAYMIFPQLLRLADLGLLLLRLMVGIVFLSSGWSHLKDPEERGKSIGMSKGFTILLGAAEAAGALGVIFGVLTQAAAIGLILVMFGAIYKKTFVWHTGFWGEKNSGWHYDLAFVVMNLVILFTAGGGYVLWK
jgi:putative oxidoreductase